MKNKDKKKILLIILIVLVISMVFLIRKNNTVYKYTNKSNSETFAIMIEKAEGRYIKYNERTWPKIGYAFNGEKTTCVDNENNNLGNLVEFDNRTHTAIMKSKKTAFCTLYFDIDNTPPDGSFYIGTYESQQYTNNKYEEIHITIDAEDTTEYCLTDVEDSISCTNKWKTLPVLEDNKFKTNDYNFGEDGKKIVYLYLKDAASNISQVKEDDIVLDTSAPECIIGGNPINWKNTNVTLTQNGIDRGEGTVYYSWDNKNNYSTTKKNKIVVANGTYTLYVKDGLGNETSCNVIVNKIDKQAPSCSISASPTSVTNGNVTLTGSGTDKGEGNVYYKWDNGSYGTAANTNKIKTVSQNGTYILYVKDGLGNEKNCNITINNIVRGFKFKYDGGFTYQDGANDEVTKYKDNTIEREIEIKQNTWKIKLLTSGTLKVQEINSNVDVFLVGGGGGGAQPYSTDLTGGGGAGGYTKTVENITFIGEHVVTIGPGGAAGVGSSSNKTGTGGTGGTTTVSNCSDCSAAGGNGGNRYTGGSGGSGGGGGSYTTGQWYPYGACWELYASSYTFDKEVVRSLGGYDGASGQKGGSNWKDQKPNSSIERYSDNGKCGLAIRTVGGTGAGQSTREFGEANGKLYAGGGNGGCRFYARYGNGTSGSCKVTRSPENATDCMYMSFNGSDVVCITELTGGAESYSDAEANTGGGGGGGVNSPDVEQCGPHGNTACGIDVNYRAGAGGSGIVVIRNTR